MRHQRLIVFATLLLLLAPWARGQEWPRFRGPNGSGINEAVSIPARWTASDYKWKIALPGGGHSSPVLWGDRLFITSADDDTARRSVLCLSARDGATLWKLDFDSQTFRQHGDNSYASSTPAVDADGVYVCWTTPEEFTLLAFDHNGKQRWKANLGPFISQHGGGNSPIVVGDVVLIGDDQEGRDSFLFGVDRTTGDIRWKLQRKRLKFSASTPVLLDTGASPLAIFASQGEGLSAVDPASGKIQWSLPGVFDSRTVSSPVTAGGLVYATCGEGAGGHVLIAARPPGPGAGSAQVAYRLTDATPYVPTPLPRGGLLFFLSDSGTLSCFAASTGTLVWQQRIGGSFYSSPVCAGDQLFCTTKKGQVIVVKAAEKFELLAKNDLGYPEKCHATPAIAEGCMFVRTYSHLLCIKGVR